PHAINRNTDHVRGRCSRGELLVVLGLEDLAAAIKTVGRNVVTQMQLARGGLDCCRRVDERIVRTMHTALRGRLLVLLNSHDDSWERRALYAMQAAMLKNVSLSSGDP